MTGMLSMVGTPIGNLQDASPRVISTLDAADVVLCEDTRVTGKLMAAFGLHTHLERCDENVIEQRVPTVLDRLRAGERVAFVSDAGMPGVSDPGQRLVDAALDEGLAVEVIPGPSAVTCALVASGLASEHFFFEGFLPRRKSAQVTRLRELALVPGTIVCYESPTWPRSFRRGAWRSCASSLSSTRSACAACLPSLPPRSRPAARSAGSAWWS